MRWIVGTGIGIVAAILTTGVGLAALMVSLIAGVNTRIDDVRGELRDLRIEVKIPVRANPSTRITAEDASPASTRLDCLNSMSSSAFVVQRSTAAFRHTSRHTVSGTSF